MGKNSRLIAAAHEMGRRVCRCGWDKENRERGMTADVVLPGQVLHGGGASTRACFAGERSLDD